jgi:hypothetical protein
MNKRKKLLLFAVNGILLVVVLYLVYLKVYKINVAFSCDYGTQPAAFVEIIQEHFKGDLEESKGIQAKLIFVFNELPHAANLENIDKLYTLYRDRLSCNVIFTKKIRVEVPVRFPYRFLSRYRFSCETKDIRYKQNFYLLLIGDHLVYSSKDFNFLEMNFIVKKNIEKDFSVAGSQLSVRELRERVIQKLDEKGLELMDIITNQQRRFESFSEFSEIYFFHVSCSGCQLKTMLNTLKLKRIFDEEKVLIIFSFFANRFDLKSLLEQEEMGLPVYIDYKDEFLLHSKMTNDKENPIIIRQEELRSGQ